MSEVNKMEDNGVIDVENDTVKPRSMRMSDELIDDIIDVFGKRCEKFGYENWLGKLRNHELPDKIEFCTINSNRFSLDKHEEFWADDYCDTTLNLNGNSNIDYGDYRECYGNYNLYTVRDCCIQIAGFAPITKSIIDNLAYIMIETAKKPLEDIKVLDLCCGLGMITKALRDKGIAAYGVDLEEDTYLFDYNNRSWIKDKPYKLKMDMLDAMEVIKPDFVICSWPRPEVSEKLRDVAKKLYEYNPEGFLVYIGEESGGCTADEFFFVDMEDVGLKYDVYQLFGNYVQFEGIADHIELYRYDNIPKIRLDAGDYPERLTGDIADKVVEAYNNGTLNGFEATDDNTKTQYKFILGDGGWDIKYKTKIFKDFYGMVYDYNDIDFINAIEAYVAERANM